MNDIAKRLLRETRELTRNEAVARLRHHAADLTLTERFTLLHELGIYAGSESLSGHGSSLEETRSLRNQLPRVFTCHGIKCLLDLPCGDAHWIRSVDLSAVRYIGGDIVASLVQDNRQKTEGTDMTFEVLDITLSDLPCVDLVLCRDLLIHLSNEDIVLAISNVVRSGSRLLLASHYSEVQVNSNIVSGEFRPMNLCRPPFNLPVPLEVLSERSKLGGGEFRDRSMALWMLDEISGCTVKGNSNNSTARGPSQALENDLGG